MDESNNINELLSDASNEGILSQTSIAALNFIDLGDQINAAMGINANEMQISEVVLVTMMVDDSGSIRFSGNTKNIIEGHNNIIETLNKSQERNNILMHTRYLNGNVLFPYCPSHKAVKMNKSNYNPDLGTPLYDQTVVVLGTVIAKAQSFANNGIPVRTITLLLTDGEDCHSVKASERSVASIVKDMQRSENHIIAALGVQSNGHVPFRDIFQKMGIEDQWILTTGNSEHEIRRAFHLFSRSVVAASKTSTSFSQLSLGGFGN